MQLQSEALLHSLLPLELLDQLGTGVFVTDALGSVLAVNHTAAEMLGYAQEELVGKNLAAFTHPDDSPRETLGAVGPGRTVRTRRRLLHKDGQYRVTESTARALDDGRVVSVVSDVTALLTAKHALHENAEQLRFAANAVPALIAYVDTDVRYVWTNDSYRRWFDSSPEEIRGLHASAVLGAAAWDSIRPYVERVLAGETVTFDHRLVYKTGPARDVRAAYIPHLDAEGRVRGFVGLINDITEIRAAERALRRSEHMLEHSQSTAHVGSWEVIAGSGPTEPGSLRWSDETYRIFGHEPRAFEVTLPFFFESVHPADSRRDTRGRQGRLRAGRALREGVPHRAAGRDGAPDPRLEPVRARLRRGLATDAGHPAGHHRPQPRRTGAFRRARRAEGGRSAQGRVPGDALARAAQSAGPHPQRRRGARARGPRRPRR